MKGFRLPVTLFAAALIFCSAAARAEVEKFLNPCSGQQLCPSFRLLLTPPDGWVLDQQATRRTTSRSSFPKARIATAEPLMYVQVFYHKDKQQSLADFARVSNERWLAASGNAKITDLPAVARANGKPGFLRFAYENPNKAQQAYEVGAFGIDSDKDGNEFVLDIVMTGSTKKALDRAENDYVGFLKLL